MKEKIKNLLFFANISNQEYAEYIAPQINADNRIMINTISPLATILIAMMFISSLFVDGARTSQIVYGISAIISLLLFLASAFFAKKHTSIIMPLVYLSYFAFYTYGIVLSVVADSDQRTVAFIGMLVFLPVLLVDRPINSIAITIVYVIIFIALCFNNKTGTVLIHDILDAIAFGTLGIVAGIKISHIRVRGYATEAQLKKVSRIDRLTGMNNRNAYELDLYTIPEKCLFRLSCVYIDANGLKRLNDTYGHKSGDNLLKCIAKNILEVFGDEFSYRLGGDEFIIFIPDRDDVKEKVQAILANLENSGYKISAGWDSCQIDRLSLTSLINSAESKMYKNKAEFYRNAKNDRRHSEA